MVSLFKDGNDYSTKGCIDLPIEELVYLINSHHSYYTTSSCSGRVSIYRLENCNKDCNIFGLEDEDQVVDNKGVNWLLVKHSLLSSNEVKTVLELSVDDSNSITYMKCEGMILHISCTDLNSANALHKLATQCGYREGGINIGQKNIILAIRTTSFGMELPLAIGNKIIFDNDGLNTIVLEANKRLLQNFLRLDKFTSLLKENWKYPIINIVPSPVSSIKRWGHSLSLINEQTTCDWICFDGYGMNDENRVGRNLTWITSTSNTISSHNIVKDNAMHSVSVTVSLSSTENSTASKVQVVIISGGRTSPYTALPCIRRVFFITESYPTLPFKEVINLDQSNPTIDNIHENHESSYYYTETGDIPPPRWGHSLTYFQSHTMPCIPSPFPSSIPSSSPSSSVDNSNRLQVECFILHGGRDQHNIYDTSYILSIRYDSSYHVSSSSSSRFVLNFHWKQVSLRDVLHGVGSKSIHPRLGPRFFHSACCINDIYLDSHVRYGLISSSCKEETSSHESKTVTKNGLILIHGGISSLNEPSSIDSSIVIDPIEAVYWSLIAVGKTPQHIDRVERLGHTINAIGAKTLLLIGGTSFNNDVEYLNNEVLDLNGKSIAIDLFVDLRGLLRGRYRHIPLMDFNGNEVRLPDQDCRSHHQTYHIPSTIPGSYCGSSLVVIGGGVSCMAFGPHYCGNLKLKIDLGCHDNVESKESLSTRAVDAFKSAQKSMVTLDVNGQKGNETTGTFHLMCPKQRVKKVKTWLESKGWYNKSLSIIPFDIISNDMELHCIEKKRFANEGGEVFVYSSMTSVDWLKRLDFQAVGMEDVQRNWMSIPIQNQIVDILANFLNHPHHDSDEAGGVVVHDDIKTLMTFFEDKADDNQDSYVVTITFYESKTNKKSRRLVSHLYQSAHDWLAFFMNQHNIPITNEMRMKYEIVGDILMIQEQAFINSYWQEIFIHEKKLKNILWKSLANCFGLTRVAKKAEIDQEAMRRSHVRILYPSVDEDQEGQEREEKTGPGSPGWVTVVENKISYSFDITRVMFCSGNVTERMRMATIRVDEEVIIDFYCGIGYYTIPLLCHGNAKHVYACEWNPNSILALKENLQQNNVNPSKITILEGDNRITSLELVDVADRMVLGLLPSSKFGWELAARSMKPSGGWIHIHENVKENEINSWIESTVEEFRILLTSFKKNFKNIIPKKLEKVKSYAPRVYHIVLDLHCYDEKE